MFEYIGRIDHQVKINGFRVEPGEVEAHLNARPGIRDSVVVARTETGGHPYLTAFWIGQEGDDADIGADALRAWLSDLVPEYMIPARFERLADFPLTPNRKIDRRALAVESFADLLDRHGVRDHRAAPPATASRPDGDLPQAIAAGLRDILADLLGVEPDGLPIDRPLGELGFDSIRFTRLAVELNRRFDTGIDATLFFQLKTVRNLADHFARHHADRFSSEFLSATSFQPPAFSHQLPAREQAAGGWPLEAGSQPIAIIGVDARLPRAADIDRFWRNLIEGRDCVTELPAERRALWASADAPIGAYIDDIDAFDAPFFGISPREAAALDPRQRLFLETAWRAIEDAGLRPGELAGSRTGVFVGVVGVSEYDGESADPSVDSTAQRLLGTAPSFIASRVSHQLDLHGPSAIIDTACSSSLVAVHRAVVALQAGECEMAIVGGVNLILDPDTTRAAATTGMISPTGRCRTFDAAADGYVRGEGVAALLLKPLAAAQRDGDPIQALILGTAENHGGRAAALTAPNPVAQSGLIQKAFRRAGVDPSTVTYIETHGTGTPLGDPIEINGLKDAFAALRPDAGRQEAWCGLGSVKTHIGHLEAAAGIAGLIKVLLAMRHGEIPGNLHFATCNPNIDLARSPFFIVDDNRPWRRLRDGSGLEIPRRAGVSSFGFSGSNAHVVLEEYAPEGFGDRRPEPARAGRRAPLPPHPFERRRYWLRPLAARSAVGSPEIDAIADAVDVSSALDPARVARDGEGFDDIERIGRLIVLRLLQARGRLREPGEYLSVADLRALLEAAPGYARLCDLLVGFLTQGGILEERDGGLVATEVVARPQTVRELSDLDEVEAAFCRDHPELAPHGRFAWRCIEALPDVISRRLPATEVLFPQGSVEAIARIYQGTPLMDHFNRLTAAVVREAVRRLLQRRDAAHGPIRVLEVGAGSGATTLEVATALAEFGDRVEYVYSDVAAGFMRFGQSRLRPLLPRLEFRRLDLEQDGVAQGFERQGFEIVIGANVLHTTRRLQRSLGTIKGLLKPRGLLVLVEAIEARIFNGLTYGLLEGWWQIEDAERRLPNAPHLSAEQWLRVLREEGFGEARVLGRSSDLERRMFQAVILGELAPEATGAAADPVPEVAAPRQSPVQPSGAGQASATGNRAPRPAPSSDIEVLEQRIVAVVRRTLQSESEFSIDDTFESLGVDSILAVEIAETLNAGLPVPMRSTDLFNFATVRRLGRHLHTLMERAGVSLAGEAPPVEPSEQDRTEAESGAIESGAPTDPRLGTDPRFETDVLFGNTATPIAIIGLACQYPEAADAEEFWSNLKNGRDCIREVPHSRWPLEGFFSEDRRAPARSYGKWGGFLRDAAGFDPYFFNFSPRDADLMDPQQRLFLMESWHALEDAGYSDRTLDGSRCGVFAGCVNGDYEFRLREGDDWGEAQSFTGNAGAILAARLAYHLNLRGPCLTIDTACSSSLVAVHTACESLRAGSCDLALAGGVTVLSTPRFHVWASKAGMLSADGRCRTFAADADGIVPSEGVGVVVLKRLDEAIRDGDPIRAVIRGSGVNQDGKTNGITAPSAPSQTALEVEVYEQAGIDPETIDYIECHGTGTRLGDPIEVQALTDAFRRFTNASDYCGLGSVKTNIGHALSAAGVAGLIKLVLALEHDEIPPSLHGGLVNPKLELAGTPFRLTRESRPWRSRPDRPRRAAVSAFGFSGTNAHVLIEEAPRLPPVAGRDKPAYLLTLSAKTDRALQRRLADLSRWLTTPDGRAATLQAVSRTLNLGRSHFRKRCAFVAASMDEFRELVDRVVGGDSPQGYIAQVEDRLAAEDRRLGAQRLARRLEDLRRSTGESYRLALLEIARDYTRGLDPDWEALHDAESPRRCSMPGYPFDLRPFWYGSGDGPEAIRLEPVAATGDGWTFSRHFRADEPLLAHHRVQGRPILPGVGYLELVLRAVRSRRLQAGVELRSVTWLRPFENGGELRVAPAPTEAGFRFSITRAGASGVELARGEWRVAGETPEAERVDLAGLRARLSEHIDGAAFYDWCERSGVDYGAYFRCLTDLWLGAGESLAHLRLPADGEHDWAESILHSSLLDGALQAAAGLLWSSGEVAPPRLPFGVEQVRLLAPLQPEMWVHVRGDLALGAEIDLLDPDGLPCVRLTGYTTRESVGARVSAKEPSVEDPLVREPNGLYLEPVWVERVPAGQRTDLPSGVVWLVSNAQHSFERRLSGRLDELYELRLGRESGRLSETVWTVDVRDPGAMSRVIAELPNPGAILWSLHPEPGERPGALEAIRHAKETGVLAMFRLIRALQSRGAWEAPLRLILVTRNIWTVVDQDRGDPAFAAVVGLFGSVRNENPDLVTLGVDLEEDSEASVEASLAAVFSEPPQVGNTRVAWRAGRRYEQVLRPIEPAPAGRRAFRERGVYLIAGGAGGIGYALARHLASEYHARIALLGRRPADREIEHQLVTLAELGGEALYLRADIADAAEIKAAFSVVRERWGRIDGVVHSALVLRDRWLARMREEDFLAALDPKVEGIVNLAHAARRSGAGWLLAFSSINAFLTAAGQSNYAAGSLFLDSYARWARDALGLPTRVIDWGYWGEIGVVADEHYRTAMTALGWSSIHEAEGLEVIERVLAQDIPQIIYAKGSERLMRDQLGVEFEPVRDAPGHDTSWRFEDLIRDLTEADPDGSLPTRAALQRDAAALERLDRLAERLLIERLRSLGGAGDDTGTPDLDRLAARLGVIPRHDRLLGTLRGILTQAAAGGEQEEAAMLERRFLEEHPGFAGHVELLRTCVEALPEVLRGRRPATEVMFPGGSLRLVERIYSGTAQIDYLNQLLSIVVEGAVRRRLAGLTPGQKVRVVEIGAGTGSTTAVVARALRRYADRVDYVFTDVSMGFRKRFDSHFAADYPFMRFEVMDLDRGLEEQRLAAGEADIILAANALHVCASLERSLRLLRELLHGDGLLVLNEVQKVTVFNSLTYGLLDGWWRFEDGHRRLPGSPILDRARWERALIEEGFSPVAFAERLRHASDPLIGTVVFARSGGAPSPSIPHDRPEDEASPARRSADRADAPRADRDKTVDRRVRERIAAVFERVIRVPPSDLTPEATFDQLGVDSIVAAELVEALNQAFGVELRSVDLFNYTTLPSLADRLITLQGTNPVRPSDVEPVPNEARVEVPVVEAPTAVPNPAASFQLPASSLQPESWPLEADRRKPDSDAIAIIGYSLRVPGADSPAEFWSNLRDGIDSVREVSPERWRLDDFHTEGRETPGRSYCRHGGFLSNIDGFDPLFFNISPHEAELMDPQQRIFLMECWKALEDAGYAGSDLDGRRCGVFAGCSVGDYESVLRAAGRDGEAYAFMGLSPAILPSRISYWLNLKGPSIAVDTACSASAVAIHLACESLRQGASDMALSGGVSILSTPRLHVLASQTGMLSRTGACRAFGAGADGFVPSEACAVLLLKRLDEAVRDGDHIHGVIRGSAINQDGKTTGITAPNGPSQTALIRSVYERHEIDPTTIGYVECHGTGTKLGDPIEIGALTDAFRTFTDRRGFCPLGSVKSNIGHAMMASAAVSVIKVLLALKHAQIPPTLHCDDPNPDIDFAAGPFFPNLRLRPWTRESGRPRRAAVSSFGFSGTNVHLVIEDPPARPPAVAATGDRLFTLSARDPIALRRRVEDLVAWLDDGLDADSPASLEEISHGLNVGRSHFEHRLALVAGDRLELRQSLRLWLEGALVENLWSGTVRRSVADDVEAVSVDGPPTRARLLELAALYVSGREVAWSSLHARPVRRIQLPVYPFTLERFWADPPERGEPGQVRPVEASSPVSPSVEEMLFAPVWREAPMTGDPTSPPLGAMLVVDQGDGLARAIAERYPDLRLIRSQPTGETEYADLIATQAPRVILVRAQEGVIGIEEVYRLARALVSSPGSRPVRLILVLSSEAPPALAAIPAFLATLAQERPGIRVLSLTLDDDRAVADELFADDSAREVRRCAGGREIRTLEAHPLGAVGLGFRESGVCLISGGAGGLGWILSRHLVETYRARLVWIGRSEPDARLRARIQELAALGGQVLYVRGDVGREEDVQSAVRLARERFGAIHAVIHAAGVIHNNFLIKKELGEFRRVLAPKLLGAMHLDAVLKDEPLDVFVLFSSVAGVLPEPGQGDYAYANRFLGEFAAWREGLRAQGRRHGRSLAIDWQMWRDGGMATGMEAAEQTERQSGLPALESASGLRLLERALGSAGLVSGLCCLGRRDRVVERIAQVQANPAFSSRPPASSFQLPAGEQVAGSRPLEAGRWKPEADALQQIEQFVKQQVAELFKVPLDQFEMERPFAEYGLDSILVTRFNARITELIPEVSRTLLFEFPHARALSAHLFDTHRAELESLFDVDPIAQERPEPTEARAATIEDSPSVHTVPEVQSAPQPDATEIAIIGLAGRYPQAPDLATFWDNLTHGRDCIREVPPERWDAESCHDPDPARAAEGKIYCKWGGFLDGVDLFDPGFFSMAPVEAETLDPQTRLFLHTAWHALEDAGYARSRLLAWHRREERARVGVFAGVTQNSYQLLGVMRNLETRTRVDQSGEWSLANHVSYFFDFSGPSLPVDTACSSSLTAIHLACESLRRGECDLALAGGVNLHLHPIKYASACALGMLSPSGRCHSFGADGDGYVPGEGVGVVILKPLAQARRDGDHIYGVIKASAVNHGGRTNGFTVPSPAAQGAVVSQALRQASIDPRTIGYVEAHGTGTRLGDPIEVDGLTRAFTSGRDAGASGWCALGSVKSNIGHLEAAAGIAGLTKILLQFRHRTLVPTLNAERPNPDIDFSRTPFVLQRELRDWVVPEGQPRRAGLSSFGAGGTNAHLIVEEYRMERREDRLPVTTTGSEWLIPLSARGETELRNAVGNLLGYLWSPDAEADLSALAYTLQVARAELAERVAFVVGDLEALKRRLAAFLDSEPTEAIRGRADQERVAIDPVAIDRMDLRAIARAWVTGAEIDWRVLHPGDVPHRVPLLPGYPFLADRYWYGSFVSGKATADRPAPAPVAEPPAARTVVDTTHWRASAGHFEARPEVRMERLDAGILVVRMEDRANRNMFTEALLHGLMHCFDQVERDPSVRVVVVTGCDKVFSMGGTREELLTLTGNVATFADMEFIFKGFLQCRVPVIAAIQGHASGGGLVFGLYADMVVMAEEGLYSAVFTKYGFTPGLGATLILPDKLGGALAVEMMMTAATYRGADLKQRGANVLFQPQARVLDEAIALARSLTRIPDYTLRTLKDSLAREKLARLPAVIAEELRMHGETFGHPEVKARISRFFRDDGEDQGDEDADLKETAGDESSAMDAAVPAVEPPPPAIASGTTVPAVEVEDLRRTMALSLCDKLHIEPGTLDRRMSFRDLGLDSITGVEFIHEVNRTFGLGLDASIVYDLTHFDALADHVASLVETMKPATAEPPAAKPPSAPARLQLRDVRADTPSPPAEARTPIRLSPVGTAVAPNATPTPEPGREPNASRATEPPGTRPGEMAIIGLSCRLPGAPDLDTFWRHLAQGVDSVSVVPRDRFDVEPLFDPDPEAIDKTYCKWGGFIDEVDRFDPLFFNLSHAEAEVMDPQQRLFLEEAWKAFEHAGYCSRSLNGARCGLFVGAATGEYGAVLKRENPELFHTAFAGMGLTPSIMVARISYLLNLKGPSMALDTACSSSLVALHQACRSLEVGDCDLALAGGINLILEPDQLVTTSKLRMLSPTGRCRPFDHRADGIALSEGVAMVIVKRLDEALRDGDHIYGVIEATGINQDGKTNGITSPSAPSQTELQRRVLERAGVNPEWIGLMEAHGTGTRLGDPVEVRGLNETFRAYTRKRGFCALGSVKSNIGHTSFASGLAGLIKVLLSFEHERIPPTLHFERPNEEIRFEDSPFFVNTDLREWRRTPGRPRHAAVSSFGYSGTNAYAVLSDFDDGGRAESEGRPELIVLSAKTREALDESVARLHDRLDPSGATFRANLRLDDLAFTLQTGRDALEFRLAWIVGGLDALRQRLAEARRGDLSHAYQGLPVRDSGRMPVAAERQAALETDAETELPRLARAWVEGAEIDWTPLWRSRSARRTALPTYPFARERCWVQSAAPDRARTDVGVQSPSPRPLPAGREPERLPTDDSITIPLAADDLRLLGHRVKGHVTVSGALMLELVAAAIAETRGGAADAVEFEQVVWLEPLVAENGVDLRVRLDSEPGGTLSFQILAGTSPSVTHAEGRARIDRARTPERVDHSAWPAAGPHRQSGDELYAWLARAGLDYRDDYRVIEDIQWDDDRAIARLRLPAGMDARKVLNCFLLDGALQAASVLAAASGGATAVPFAIDRLWCNGLNAPGLVEVRRGVRRGDIQTFDLRLFDQDGLARLEIQGFGIRASGPPSAPIYLRPHWERRERPDTQVGDSGGVGRLLLFGDDDGLDGELRAAWPRLEIQRVNGSLYPAAGHRNEGSSSDEFRGDETSLERLLETTAPDYILYRLKPTSDDPSGAFESLFPLSKALVRQGLTKPVTVLCLGSDASDPAFMALGAFGRTVAQEQPMLRIKTLATGSADVSRLREIVAELW